MEPLHVIVALLHLIPLGYGIKLLVSRAYSAYKLRRLLERLGSRQIASVFQPAEGNVCLEALVRRRAGELLTAPISGQRVLGFRLVGVVDEGVTRDRERVVDVTRVGDLELEDAAGNRVWAAASSWGLLGWPPHRHQRPLARLDEATRDLVCEHASLSREELERHATMFWTEWLVMPGDLVRVVGRTEERVAVDGRGSYRQPPSRLQIGPLEGLPLLVFKGPEAQIVSNLTHSQLVYPQWLASIDL